MIPVLYDTIYTDTQKTKIAYLGNLVSCVVTEERNGIYELTAEMPNGVYPYTQIKAGMVIEAQASQVNGVQAFRIDEVNSGIDGNMTIHANHISYDLLYHTVDPSLAISSTNVQGIMQTILNEAHTYSSDANWTSYSDITTTKAYSVNTAKTVRNALGGSEGSLLDEFGGEFEFDNFTVKLLNARGSANSTPIYYGSNLISFDKKILDDAYTDVQAFVTIEDTTVTSQIYRISGYDTASQTKVLLLDWSDKYEELPAQTDLDALVSAYATSGKGKSKTASYEVQFVPLTGNIGLCDTVTAHSRDGEEFEAKISRTEWNVLKDRYDAITIGDLPSSLASVIEGTVGNTTINIYSGSEGGTQTVFFGTCSTAAATQAKAVTCPGYTLATGNVIFVEFANAQTYNGVPTLNVNGTGAKNARRLSGTNAARYEWQAGEVVGFVYNGTYYVIIDGGIASTTYYGATKLLNSVTSTSNAYAATPNAVKMAYDNGGVQSVNGQTGAVTIAIPTKTSELTNDSGFITSGTMVTSVNGETGDVTISIPTKTSDLTNDSGYLTSVPVTSVNTKTGAVVLTASDVGALPSNTTYVSTVNGQSGAVSLTIPTVPTNVSAFTNDAGYATEDYVDTAISGITPSGEANVIESVKVNGDALTVTDKSVDVKVPVRSAYSTNAIIDGEDAYFSDLVFLGIKRTQAPSNTSYVTESVYVPKVTVTNGKIGIDSRLLSDYYTKADIDTKIGDIETLLASI